MMKRGLKAGLEAFDHGGQRSWLVRCGDFELDKTFIRIEDAETYWYDVESGRLDRTPF